MSHGSVLAPEVDSKWVPNRVIDVGGVRKALGTHLRRYHSALGAILGALEGYKMGVLTLTFQQPCSNSLRRGEGERINLSQGLGIGGLDSKKTIPTIYTP